MIHIVVFKCKIVEKSLFQSEKCSITEIVYIGASERKSPIRFKKGLFRNPVGKDSISEFS